jgi:GNAT superfamily N-acetyltransferase
VIRRACTDDLPDLLRMGEAFYATTAMAERVPHCPASAEATARQLLASGIVLVDVHAGRLVGMLGMLVAPTLMNHAVSAASEVMWWVDADARRSGAGVRLIRAAERAAREAGAAFIHMLRLESSPPAAALLYTRMGYAPSESAYTKVLC